MRQTKIYFLEKSIRSFFQMEKDCTYQAKLGFRQRTNSILKRKYVICQSTVVKDTLKGNTSLHLEGKHTKWL